MAAKPGKSLELHYTTIQFLIIPDIRTISSSPYQHPKYMTYLPQEGSNPQSSSLNARRLNTHGSTTITMAGEPSDAEIQSAIAGKGASFH